MKLNPFTKEIFTNDGDFIKTLNCPIKVKWNALKPIDLTARKCTICNRYILDTDKILDTELLSIVRENPETCLKLDLNQNNVTLISHTPNE